MDLIFTNNEEIIHDIEYFIPPQSISDHYVINVMTKLNASIYTAESDEDDIPLAPLKTLNYHSEDIDWIEVIEEFDNISWIDELADLSPDEMVAKITSLSYGISTKHIPVSTTRSVRKINSIPTDRKKLMRRRRRVNQRYTRTRSPSTKSELWKELIQIEKALHKSRQASLAYAENKAIGSIKKNAKYFFTYAKKFSKIASTIGPLRDVNNKFVHNNK